MPQASVLEKWSPPPPCTSGQPHSWLLGAPEPHTGIVRGHCERCPIKWWWPGSFEVKKWTEQSNDRRKSAPLLDLEEVPVEESDDGLSQAPVSQETPELPTDQPRR